MWLCSLNYLPHLHRNEKESKLEWSTNCGIWNPRTLWRWGFTPVLIHRHKHHRATFWGGEQYSGSNSPWRKPTEKWQPFSFLSEKLITLIFLFKGENCWRKDYNWEDFQVLVRICQWRVHKRWQLWDSCSCRSWRDPQSSNDRCLLPLCKFGLSCMDEFRPYVPASIELILLNPILTHRTCSTHRRQFKIGSSSFGNKNLEHYILLRLITQESNNIFAKMLD